MKTIKKQILNSKTIYIFLFYLFVSLMMIILFNQILSQREIFYDALEYQIIVFGLIITTNYFKNIKDKNFIKVLKIKNELSSYLVSSFFVILFMMFMMIVSYLLVFFTLSIFNLLNINNLINYDYIVGPGLPRKIIWFSNENKNMLFLFGIIMETILIILFSITLILLLTNKVILNAIIVVIMFYTLIFGDIFYSYVDLLDLNEDGSYYLYLHEGSQKRLFFNCFFFPWFQIGSVINELFLIPSVKELVNFTDYSNLEFFKILKYSPYIYLFLMTLFISLKLKKER